MSAGGAIARLAGGGGGGGGGGPPGVTVMVNDAEFVELAAESCAKQLSI
jgi:hypothetical protein